MKRLLLDSHVFLWWLTADTRLGPAAHKVLEDGDSEIHVSAASIWELEIKRSLGKLGGVGSLIDDVAREGFKPLPISLDHARTAAALPLLHRDPFDRMLVAQAKTEGLGLLTGDHQLPAYDVSVLDARS